MAKAYWVSMYRSISNPEAVAAYAEYDVLLVNAIFDGMNLVAKEAPLVNERDGAVVLSENAGAHEDIGEWTITVNPFDIEGMAEGLYQAVTMPPAPLMIGISGRMS